MFNGALANIRERLIESMVKFMESDEGADSEYSCGYTQIDIDNCDRILDAYFQSLQHAAYSSPAQILAAVQNTVEKLNELNKSCDGCLIETDQREDLCQLILTAAENAGLETDHDVTEQWREW